MTRWFVLAACLFAAPVWAADTEITPAVEKQTLELLAEVAPSRHAELMRLKTTDPLRYQLALRRAARLVDFGDDPASIERMRKVAAADARLDELAVGFSTLSAADQRSRRAEMVKLAGEIFDLKQAQRRDRVTKMREKLTKLEAEIAERDKRRTEIVDGYVDGLISPKSGL